MVFREIYETQDVRRMCKHAERGHETKKLLALFDRLNQKMAERGMQTGGVPATAKPPATVLSAGGTSRHLGGLSLLER